MSGFHLAQLNIARMHAPLHDPVMAGFVEHLDRVNALADASPGFVWRMAGHGLDHGAAALLPADEAVSGYAAESILANLSVWESVEQLQRFVYGGAHAALLPKRRNWFSKFEGRWSVLWWVPAGHRPTVSEGKERLDYLRASGESAYAFNFKKPFPPPDTPETPLDG